VAAQSQPLKQVKQSRSKEAEQEKQHTLYTLYEVVMQHVFCLPASSNMLEFHGVCIKAVTSRGLVRPRAIEKIVFQRIVHVVFGKTNNALSPHYSKTFLVVLSS
jgi:hypothetical protein